MATHRLPILGWATKPGPSGDVFFQSYDVVATNNFWDHLVLTFNDTSLKDICHGKFTVPKNFVGSAKVIVVWTCIPTSGNVVFDFDYRGVGGNDTESLDQATAIESVTVTDAAPSAIHERMEAEMTLTSSNLAVDDEVQFHFSRDGAVGGPTDTIAGAVHVFQLIFEYADV